MLISCKISCKNELIKKLIAMYRIVIYFFKINIFKNCLETNNLNS